MNRDARFWTQAIVLAVLVHGVVMVAVLERAPRDGALAPGRDGMEVGVGLAGRLAPPTARDLPSRDAVDAEDSLAADTQPGQNDAPEPVPEPVSEPDAGLPPDPAPAPLADLPFEMPAELPPESPAEVDVEPLSEPLPIPPPGPAPEPVAAQKPEPVPEPVAAQETAPAPETEAPPPPPRRVAGPSRPVPDSKPREVRKLRVAQRPEPAAVRPDPAPERTTPPRDPAPRPAPTASPQPAPHAPRDAAQAEESGPSGNATTAVADNADRPGEAATGSGADPRTGGDPAARRGYLAEVAALIARNKRYPRDARRDGVTGVVTVRFAIAADGALTAREVVRSSGDPRLDEAALKMLRRASPFPPIPASLAVGRLELTLPVEFSLRQKRF